MSSFLPHRRDTATISIVYPRISRGTRRLVPVSRYWIRCTFSEGVCVASSARLGSLFSQICVVLADPVFSARSEKIDVHCIFLRDSGMRHIPRNYQKFARANDNVPVVEDKFQFA